jgi:hypothetical protein
VPGCTTRGTNDHCGRTVPSHLQEAKLPQDYICRLFKIAQVLKIKFCAPPLSNFSLWAGPSPKRKASTGVLALGESDPIRYLLHVSLTILRSVTRKSPYSSLPAAFSTWPSFFSSAFSSAFDSW